MASATDLLRNMSGRHDNKIVCMFQTRLFQLQAGINQDHVAGINRTHNSDHWRKLFIIHSVKANTYIDGDQIRDGTQL